MTLADSHTHLYLEQFDQDREETVKRAVDNGVQYMFLPNINKDSIDPMMDLTMKFPDNCFPMIGLHPTSVKEDYLEQLEIIEGWAEKGSFSAIGEIGIDLYWDKTFFRQQEEVFRKQIRLAKAKKLAIVIHTREAFNEIFRILEDEGTHDLEGVFHCFTGNLEQAKKITGWGLKLGIGGVVTWKNAKIAEVIKHIDLKHILLETDSPYLAPDPYRGKRNESAYIRIIAEKIAQVKEVTVEALAEQTTRSTLELFRFQARQQ